MVITAHLNLTDSDFILAPILIASCLSQSKAGNEANGFSLVTQTSDSLNTCSLLILFIKLCKLHYPRYYHLPVWIIHLSQNTQEHEIFCGYYILAYGLCPVVIARSRVQYDQYFPKSSYLANLFYEPLGKKNNSKI